MPSDLNRRIRALVTRRTVTVTAWWIEALTQAVGLTSGKGTGGDERARDSRRVRAGYRRRDDRRRACSRAPTTNVRRVCPARAARARTVAWSAGSMRQASWLDRKGG